MYKYKLSVVIPTKDRYNYLEPLIRLVSSFSNEDIEIVIEDNSKDNTDFLKSFDYPEIHYYYNSNHISVGDNLDNAIGHSQGEYVCVIGDDDGVLPSILDCIDWMKENNVDAVIPMIISYVWPDHDEATSRRGGVVKFYPSNDKPIIQFLNPQQTLTDAINHGFLDRGLLPICYHGIVKRSVLDAVYKIGGKYSPGPSPDIAAGVALSLVVNKYALINFPIIISGASVQHGAGAHKMKHGAAKIEDLPFLPVGTKENWEPKLPLIWTVETIWPESAIKALRYMGRDDLVDKVNYNLIWSSFLKNRPAFKDELWKVVTNKVSFVLFFIKYITNKAINKVTRKNKKLESKEIVCDNVPTIIEAAHAVNDYFKKWPI